MSLRKLLPDFLVQKIYVSAGANLGNSLSYGLDLFPGDGRRLKWLFDRWAKWEKEYAGRGFRTVELDRFLDFGAYGRTLEDVIGKRRDEKEEPIFYAENNKKDIFSFLDFKKSKIK